LSEISESYLDLYNSSNLLDIHVPFGLSLTQCKEQSFNTVCLISTMVLLSAKQHVAINSKDRISCDDAALDSRFASEARLSVHRSVVCLPIVSNRGQTFGAVYVASRFAFSKDTVTLLTLLCQQASISIANALLFLSVQTGTKENLKMIATQKDALEAARRSREDALKATKVWIIAF